MDKTKVGQVFEYIRVNGASTIKEIEKAVKFDAFTCVHGMKYRGILVSAPAKNGGEHIFEILPRTTHLVTNVKTPKKTLTKMRKYNSHPKTLIQVVCANQVAPVFKYAVGARKTVINGYNTTMSFDHNKTNLAAIKAIVASMNNDGLTVSVSQLNKVSEYVESPLF
jgi:hypothetical protein